jgi:hypothetical protein
VHVEMKINLIPLVGQASIYAADPARVP